MLMLNACIKCYVSYNYIIKKNVDKGAHAEEGRKEGKKERRVWRDTGAGGFSSKSQSHGYILP